MASQYRIVTLAFSLLLSLATARSADALDLLLFGNSDHKKLLGCISCCKYHSDSVWNRYGSHGSKYNSESIWNRYGTYGSKYSAASPWNRYGTDPPVIVDRDGNFYGYFTSNKSHSDRTQIEFFVWVLDNYELVQENFDDVRDAVKCN